MDLLLIFQLLLSFTLKNQVFLATAESPKGPPIIEAFETWSAEMLVGDGLVGLQLLF